MGATQITITAAVAAKPEHVWRCWTEPAHITRWNFAGDDWCCPHAESDLRVGGRYLARMEAKDGSFGFDLEATYTAVLPHSRLAFTMSDGRTVTTDFTAQGDGTRITTVFDAEDENPVDMQRDGWQAILNNFKAYVEAQ